MSTDIQAFEATLEQLARLERAVYSLTAHAEGDTAALQAIAIAQYEEIARLRSVLDEMCGLVDEAKADLIVRIEGRDVGVGFTPASILASMLERVRGSVLATASYVLAKAMPRGGRYPKWLEEACDLRVGGLAHGSLKLLLRLPPDKTIFAPVGWGRAEVQTSIDSLLQTAAWVASEDDVGPLTSAFPDERFRTFLLVQLLRLVPRGDVRLIELSGRSARGIIRSRLLPKAASRIRTVLRGETPAAMLASEEGVLRAIDLDTGDVELRQRPEDKPDIRCVFPEHVLPEALQAIVSQQRVIVIGAWQHDKLGRPFRLSVESVQPL